MRNGILALTGSGEYLPSMEPVDRFLLNQLSSTPRVVCLPTGAGTEGAQVIDHWSSLGIEHFTRLGAQVEAVPVTDRSSAEDDSLAARIREANFVYFSGGKPLYLYQALVGTVVAKAIMHVLDSGGIVAGCSAGAMIWGRRSTPFPWHAGFGLLPDTIIMPHYDEISDGMAALIKYLFVPLRVMVGVEGNTALVIRNGSYQVVGSGGVTVWKGVTRHRYVEGETVVWPT